MDFDLCVFASVENDIQASRRLPDILTLFRNIVIQL